MAKIDLICTLKWKLKITHRSKSNEKCFNIMYVSIPFLSLGKISMILQVVETFTNISNIFISHWNQFYIYSILMHSMHSQYNGIFHLSKPWIIVHKFALGIWTTCRNLCLTSKWSMWMHFIIVEITQTSPNDRPNLQNKI